MSDAVAIGEASKTSSVKVPTIRYYEQIGLLPTPVRSGSNRRSYGADDVRRLAFIRNARELGFEIEAIRALVTLQDDPRQSCATADALAREHLRFLEQRIVSLTALKVELERMLGECAHGRVADCRVIEVLADHGQCMSDSHARGDGPEIKVGRRTPANLSKHRRRGAA